MNFTLYVIIYTATIIGFFAVGTLVVLRQASTLYRNFAIFCYLIALWQGLQFVAQAFIGNHDLAVLLFRVSVAMSCFMAVYFLFFAATYVNWRLHPIRYIAGGTVAAVFTLLSPQLQNAKLSKSGISLAAIDVFYGVAILFAGICALYGLGLILRYTVKAHVRKSRQQGLLLTGSIFQALVVVLYITLFTPGDSATQVGIPLAALIAVALIAYTMIFHGLFDIHTFVLRAAAYATSLLLITTLGVAPIVFAFIHLLGVDIAPVRFIAMVAMASVAVYGMYYVRNAFDKLTMRLFFRYYYDPQHVLGRISSLLARTIDTKEIKAQTDQILQSTIGVSSVRFWFFSDNDHQRLFKSLAKFDKPLIAMDELGGDTALRHELQELGLAIVVRLRTTHDDLGYMALGHRRSGAVYSITDQQLLVVVANQLAIGLQNALRFQEIANFNVTLQQKIDDATRKLRRTNDKLRQMDQTKDDFISMASHQLRTPLTSVKGYVSMVLDGDAGKLTPMQRKLLNQSYISAQRMVYLISDLLNVSRLRTGKFIIEAIPSNLGKVIKDEIEQLKETAKGRNLELTYNQPENFPTLMLDETKIRQVIMNFIDNAIYYTPSGGRIQVNLVDKRDTIEFTVVDNGIGVSKHEQPHLFTKFYRANNAKHARPDGTGLGLFMAKKVVIAQGGAVIFRSQEGKGSTFGFTFAKKPLLPPKVPPAPHLAGSTSDR